MSEKRRFPRFAVADQVICSRYGKEMTMRTQNISLGGAKLEANFDLGVGENINFTILTNRRRINCKGTILAIEELKNKVYARLLFSPASDSDDWKLSDYLHRISRKTPRRRGRRDPSLIRGGNEKQPIMNGVKWARDKFRGGREEGKLQQVNSWLSLLSDMERAIITLRFGFHGEDIHTPESTGARLGLSPEKVCLIEEEAIDRLRTMSRKREIDLDDIL
jgi:hypothetical protein